MKHLILCGLALLADNAARAAENTGVCRVTQPWLLK